MPGAGESTAALRAACLAAAGRLAESADHWIVVAADARPGVVEPWSCGSFRGFGVDVPVSLSTAANVPVPALALPALIAGWLRAQAGAASARVHLVDPDASPADCVGLGATLAGADSTAGLLVLGDGAFCHGDRAPGGPDPRAAAFDANAGRAIGAADTDALLALDPGLAAALGATGRAPWQVLAGVAAGRSWRAELLHSSAAFGVGYHVAVWDAVPEASAVSGVDSA